MVGPPSARVSEELSKEQSRLKSYKGHGEREKNCRQGKPLRLCVLLQQNLAHRH